MPRYGQKADRTKYTPTRSARVRFPHDIRQRCLWKFVVLVYGLLHGYFPWDQADYPPQGLKLDQACNPRRIRIIYDPLHVDWNLSPECADLLKGMLAKDPADRLTLLQLNAHPWFQRWKTAQGPLKRPFLRRFHSNFGQYSH